MPIVHDDGRVAECDVSNRLARSQEVTIAYDSNGSISKVSVVSNNSITAMEIGKKVAFPLLKF